MAPSHPPSFHRVAEGLEVAPVVAQLAAAPELWDAHPGRRIAPGSPHAEMVDIWVRFRDPAELTQPAALNEPHWPVFYPGWAALPGLAPIAFDLMRRVEATALGGILITRLPPGGRIRWHNDRGGWHARHYETKLQVALQSDPGCFNLAVDGTYEMRPGEAWWFDNQVDHAVENRSARDRLVAILALRCT